MHLQSGLTINTIVFKRDRNSYIPYTCIDINECRASLARLLPTKDLDAEEKILSVSPNSTMFVADNEEEQNTYLNIFKSEVKPKGRKKGSINKKHKIIITPKEKVKDDNFIYTGKRGRPALKNKPPKEPKPTNENFIYTGKRGRPALKNKPVKDTSTPSKPIEGTISNGFIYTGRRGRPAKVK